MDHTCEDYMLVSEEFCYVGGENYTLGVHILWIPHVKTACLLLGKTYTL